MFLFSEASGALLAISYSVFFLYQAWHFGVQNVGVSTFISLSDRGKPLASIEKIAIKLGVAAGVLGVLRAMVAVFPGENQAMGEVGINVIEDSYLIGLAAAIPLTGVALWLVIGAYRKGNFLFGTSIFLSVSFLFPMYLTHDYWLGYLSFSVAHGLQYIIFLFTHCIGQTRKAREARYRMIKPIAPVVLLTAMVVGTVVWNTAMVKSLPIIGVAVIPSLTLGHFWVDLFLWRMRNRDRAAWVKARFGFVLR